MTKRLLLAALLLGLPLSAWALTTANNRAAAAGDYLPGSDLSTQFGRMAAAGDYLPGGGGGGSSTGATTGGRINWKLFQRRRQ